MKKHKVGDVIRLSNTAINVTIQNNNCDGTYDITLPDGIIQKNVSGDEFVPTLKEVVSVRFKRLLELRCSIERYFELRPTDCQIIINMTLFGMCILSAIGVGVFIGNLIFG